MIGIQSMTGYWLTPSQQISAIYWGEQVIFQRDDDDDDNDDVHFVLDQHA